MLQLENHCSPTLLATFIHFCVDPPLPLVWRDTFDSRACSHRVYIHTCAHGCLRPRERLCAKSRTSRQVTSSIPRTRYLHARVSSSGLAKRSLIRFITRRRIRDSSVIATTLSLSATRYATHTRVSRIARGGDVSFFVLRKIEQTVQIAKTIDDTCLRLVERLVRVNRKLFTAIIFEVTVVEYPASLDLLSLIIQQLQEINTSYLHY